MFLCHRSATCALTVTLVTLSCGVAARAQVGVAQRAPLAPVGVAPVGAGAGVVTAPAMGATPVGAVGGVKASGVNTGLLLLIGQIADGQMTLDESWKKGLLDAPKVLQLLSQTQRFTEDERNETMKRDLAELLVRYSPATVATPDELSARVRLELAIYYSRIGDARAVPLCEALIGEKLDGQQIQMPKGKEAEPDDASLWVRSVIALAQFYENTEQWQEAGETWERALTFWQDEPGWQASIRLDAARAYKETETPENYSKAKQLYIQAAQGSNALYAGGAIIEGFSQELKSNPEQAQKELLQLQKEDINPDARLATQFLLTWARYNAGDWSAFLLQSEQVLTQYESINEISRRRGFAPLALQLEDGQKWAKLWQTNVIVAEQTYLDLVFDGPLQQPVERRIFVDTAMPTQLQLTVEGDANRVFAHLEESPWAPELSDVRHQQIVVVTVAPGVAAVSATIRVADMNTPKGASLSLPIKVSDTKTGGAI